MMVLQTFHGLHPNFVVSEKIVVMSPYQQKTSRMSWNLVFVRKLKKNYQRLDSWKKMRNWEYSKPPFSLPSNCISTSYSKILTVVVLSIPSLMIWITCHKSEEQKLIFEKKFFIRVQIGSEFWSIDTTGKLLNRFR